MRIFLLCLFIGFITGVQAQITMTRPTAVPMFGTVKGKITERGSGNAIQGVSVMAKTADSVLISYTFTNEKGEYSLTKLPLNKSFEMSVKLSGYRDATTVMKLSFPQMMANNKNWELSADTNVLNEVQIKARKPPFVIRKDTLEFDATAFKLLPHAILEDLLRRLPGILIDNDGGITINGKKASKIQVDGRDFFGGNMSVATQNLPAGIIDKVQVTPTLNPEQKFNKMLKPLSDQVTINVLLKKDSNKGFLGNAMAGYGTSDRYAANTMVSSFGGRQRYGIYGNAGNGNSGSGLGSGLVSGGPVGSMGTAGGGSLSVAQGSVVPMALSSGSGGGSGGMTSGGLNDRKSISGNYNTQLGNQLKIDGNYSYNYRNSIKEKQTDRFNFQSSGGLAYNEDESGTDENNSHSLSAGIEYVPDTLSSMRFSPVLRYSPYTKNEQSNALSADAEGRLINSSGLKNHTAGTEKGFSHNFSYGKKSADDKTGFTFNWNINSSQTDESIVNFSQNEFFAANGSSFKSTIDQQGTSKESSLKNDVQFRLSRSLGKQFTTALEYRMNQQSNRLKKDMFNYDSQSGEYTAPDVAQSGNNKSSSIEQAPSVQIAYRKNRLDVALNGGMSFINQRNELFNRDTVIHNNQYQFSPKLMLNYSFLDHSSLNFSYNIASSAPSADQLSPVADVSNPLVIVVGNPFLKTALGHNISTTFSRFVAEKGLSMNMSGGASFTKNQIIQDINYDESGRQIQSFRNTDGSSALRLGGGIQGSYHIKELNIQPSLNFSTNYKKDVGYVNSLRDETKSFQYGGYAAIAFNYKEFLTVSPSANISFNQTRYLLNTRNNLNYNTQNYALNMKFSPLSRMEFGSQFSYQYNSQIPKEFQRSSSVLNSSLSWRFLKKEQLNFKMSVNDVFNNGVATTTLITPSFRENTKVNALKRYFLFSLQYNFNGLSAG